MVYLNLPYNPRHFSEFLAPVIHPGPFEVHLRSCYICTIYSPNLSLFGWVLGAQSSKPGLAGSLSRAASLSYSTLAVAELITCRKAFTIASFTCIRSHISMRLSLSPVHPPMYAYGIFPEVPAISIYICMTMHLNLYIPPQV